MKRKWGVSLVVLALALVFCLPGMAMADTLSQGFTTDFGPNTFYLWMDQTDPVFSGVSGLPANWDLFVNEPGREFFHDGQGNTSNIVFTQNWTSTGSPMPNFSFQWAEVRWNADWTSYDLLASGTASYPGFGGTSTFTHANDIQSPVPLPPSVLLLGSGLLGIGLVGWKRKRQPTA